jgi:hypothetical protein
VGTAGAVVDLAETMFQPTESAALSGSLYPTFRRSDFRWRWGAIRLHTFVFVVEPLTSTAWKVAAIAEDSRVWARDHKGGLPGGFQTGAVAVPIFIVPDLSELRSWASGPQSKRFAASLFPVVISLDGDEAAYRTSTQFVGIAFEPFLRELASRFVAAAAAAR